MKAYVIYTTTGDNETTIYGVSLDEETASRYVHFLRKTEKFTGGDNAWYEDFEVDEWLHKPPQGIRD